MSRRHEESNCKTRSTSPQGRGVIRWRRRLGREGVSRLGVGAFSGGKRWWQRWCDQNEGLHGGGRREKSTGTASAVDVHQLELVNRGTPPNAPSSLLLLVARPSLNVEGLVIGLLCDRHLLPFDTTNLGDISNGGAGVRLLVGLTAALKVTGQHAETDLLQAVTRSQGMDN